MMATVKERIAQLERDVKSLQECNDAAHREIARLRELITGRDTGFNSRRLHWQSPIVLGQRMAAVWTGES